MNDFWEGYASPGQWFRCQVYNEDLEYAPESERRQAWDYCVGEAYPKWLLGSATPQPCIDYESACYAPYEGG